MRTLIVIAAAVVAALTVVAAASLTLAADARAGTPIPDQSILQPPPPPGAVCRADGSYVISGSTA